MAKSTIDRKGLTRIDPNWINLVVEPNRVEWTALEGLSPRQIECLSLVAEGLTSKEVARRLELSPSTVDNHLRAAMGKLGVGNRGEAARKWRTWSGSAQHRPYTDQSLIEDSATSRFDAWLGFPPIGGRPNDWSLSRRLFAIVQIALLATTALATVIFTIAGIVQLLSRIRTG